MNAKRVNHVINLLINEIKVNEQSGNARASANAKELSREKGINVAKSFLNINHSDKEKDRETTNGEKKSDDRKDENVNTQKNEKEFSDDNIDDDFIRDNEKAALEFYDDKIDNYDEEYVNKKYRFGTDSCDSSLCCCGCFIPVCYQSQSARSVSSSYSHFPYDLIPFECTHISSPPPRNTTHLVTFGRHECYINQYRSLYAVNVRINDKTEFDEKEINPKKGDEVNRSNEMKENVDEIGENASNSVITTEGTKNGQSEKSLKYYAVFCVNCNNHIAYFEIEKKIFHFFDVLPD
ncbi:E2F-associated phosphoprotein, putative [Plasmodium ovale]|uniref:E2F-associated phosphoprotein, putative n=2 Tax=Plasmodium ovale TaxID=36330 RepID=A0A1A8VNH7_PLAOA|nr:E2F-associated phosphoprotein, putative [Plasmodium ovale curtisi]SBS81212.1 E2F-associated phosphoprotein, putative [Plasmodium ovale curtisi]SCN43046.1 E2F-associated phosphoprotein, putative [Plasmodium ovale]